MAKPKSFKMRTLLTLNALFRYTDREHRLNTAKLNKHLRPYGLECSGMVLSDTVKVLRELGVDVEASGYWDKYGIWLPNRPLSDDELNYLIFAVTTNPHLSKEQATYALQRIKPFVTVYQEGLLQGFVETNQKNIPDDTLYRTYSIVRDAITQKRRVRYTIDYAKYNSECHSVEKRSQWPTLFTPKCVYQASNRLYMIGYDHDDKRVSAVNLSEISDIKIALKSKDPNSHITNDILADVNPKDLIPGEYNEVIYTGPATFRCREKYLTELYRELGPPDEPVIKGKKNKLIYTVNNVIITTETLCWLSRINDIGIRIVGPEPLLLSIREYYRRFAKILTNTAKL